MPTMSAPSSDDEDASRGGGGGGNDPRERSATFAGSKCLELLSLLRYAQSFVMHRLSVAGKAKEGRRLLRLAGRQRGGEGKCLSLLSTHTHTHTHTVGLVGWLVGLCVFFAAGGWVGG